MQLESVLNSLYQKQPSRGVLRKMCCENMQAANLIYRRTIMPKCNLLNSHFDMGVLLQICRIFSEHLFLRTPLDAWFCCIPKLPNKSFILCESKLNVIHYSWFLQNMYFSSFAFFNLNLIFFYLILYFHQYVVFSHWKYLTAKQWFLVGHM